MYVEQAADPSSADGRQPGRDETMASGMSVREAQEILEIEAPYDKRTLKKAYAKMAKRWHPDAVGARGGTEQEKADAERKMMRINQAYATILSTPEAFEEAPATTAVTTVETPKPDRTEVENTTVSAEDAAAYERGVTYLLNDRNIAMADKAMEYLDSGETVFFIAGAGHFCGDKGIPELLKSKGCTVERITK